MITKRSIENFSQHKINFWQILERKSAFTEGKIASEILFLNHFINLKVSPQMFFSTQSPAESFFKNQNLQPIRTELDYIEQRVKLISKCNQLMTNFPSNSPEFENIHSVFWFLKFQLFGFGQRLINNGKVLYGLIALKESGILEKEWIKQKLRKFARKNPNVASIIAEFV